MTEKEWMIRKGMPLDSDEFYSISKRTADFWERRIVYCFECQFCKTKAEALADKNLTNGQKKSEIAYWCVRKEVKKVRRSRLFRTHMEEVLYPVVSAKTRNFGNRCKVFKWLPKDELPALSKTALRKMESVDESLPPVGYPGGKI
jgi:hypothetical protein